MSSSDRVMVRVLVLCVLGTACLPMGSEQDPRPQRLVPGWGMNTQPVSGLIEGDNFLSLVTQQVGGGEPVTLDEHFEAFLGEVALEEVTREDDHRLRVRIPPGLAPGWYPLTVVGPQGRRVELPRAYYASAEPLASLEAQAPRWGRPRLLVGERTRLELEVRNPGSTAALAVTALLRPTEEGRMKVLSEPGPVDIAPGGGTSLVWELEAAVMGEPRFTLELQGLEERVGLALQVPSVDVAPLRIGDRVSPSLALTLSPLVVNRGQRVTLTLRVTNPGTRMLHKVRPGVPLLDGGSADRVSGPEPSSTDLAPGASHDFKWIYVATSPGTPTFRVGVVDDDAFFDEPVATPEVRSPGLTVWTPGALVARFSSVPANVSLWQEFDVELEVINTGDSPVREVKVSATGTSGLGRVELVTGPDPAILEVAGHARAVFRARLKGTGRGTCVLRAGAVGKDATDGQGVTAPPDDSSSLLIR